MIPIQEQVISWIHHRVTTEYPQDVAMVLLYGSWINGTANDKSDVDCYFIPKTQRGYSFATTFILDGIGFDIFPMDWKRVEEIARLEDALIPCLGDVRILYAAGEDDLSRFRGLQAQLRQNLADRDFSRAQAKKRFEAACADYDTLCRCTTVSAGRMSAGAMLTNLADAMAFYNQTYFHFGPKRQYDDLHTLQEIPEHFPEMYRDVIRGDSLAAVQLRCGHMLTAVADFTGWECPPEAAPKETAQIAVDGESLARLYEEISSTFNKIYISAKDSNPILAFLSAVSLQWELWEFAQMPHIDLLGVFHYDDLQPLAEAAKQAEAELIGKIQGYGQTIRSYHSCAYQEKHNVN